MALASIELRDVSLQFGRDVIFEKISLSVQKGERVVIVGPSGQGKTSLLKLMAGLLAPSSGQVFIEGQDWQTMPSGKRQEILARTGMLFQKNALFDSMTCLENVAFALKETTTLSPQDILEKSRDFLERVGLAHTVELFPDEISGGMQKRLGIARALVLDPQTVFYDDPTAGLDPITSRKIVDLILELQRASQATMVAVTNDKNRALQLAAPSNGQVGRIIQVSRQKITFKTAGQDLFA